MDELNPLLSSDVWVRWRLHQGGKYRGHVAVLGPGEVVRAEGRVVDLERPPIDPTGSKLAMVAKAVRNQFGDWWVRGSSWDFRAPAYGQALFAVRPPSSRDAPSVFTVSTAEGNVIGTVSAYDHKLKRGELRSDSGAVCSYLPVDRSYKFVESRRATIVDQDLPLATVFHDRDADAVAEVVPSSGLIEAFDFGIAFAPGTDVATRLLALVAAILDTKNEEDSLADGGEGNPGTGPRVVKSHAAPGSNSWSAQKQEKQARREHHDDKLDRFQEKAQRLGKEGLAERLEKYRRGR